MKVVSLTPKKRKETTEVVGDDNGTRTHITSVKGLCPYLLDDTAIFLAEGSGLEPLMQQSKCCVIPFNEPSMYMPVLFSGWAPAYKPLDCISSSRAAMRELSYLMP